MGKTKKITLAAVFVALTVIMTVYLFHFPMSIFGGEGYIHFGDAFIYLCASILPTEYALVAAIISGALSDVLSGAAIWAVASAIIKASISLCFTDKKLICKRNIFALLLCWIITVVGYYFAEVIIYGNWIIPLYSQIGNTIQCFGSSVLYLLLCAGLQKINFKRYLR